MLNGAVDIKFLFFNKLCPNVEVVPIKPDTPVIMSLGRIKILKAKG